MTKPTLRLIPSAILIFGGLTFGASAASPIEIDGDDIGGVVQSRVGPEAGVWSSPRRAISGRALQRSS